MECPLGPCASNKVEHTGTARIVVVREVEGANVGVPKRSRIDPNETGVKSLEGTRFVRAAGGSP